MVGFTIAAGSVSGPLAGAQNALVSGFLAPVAGVLDSVQIGVLADALLRQAQENPPSIESLLGSAPGIQELFAAFIEGTLLAGPDPILRTQSSAVSSSASSWEVRDFGGGREGSTETLLYLDDRGLQMDAKLVGRLFLISPAGENAGIWSDELRSLTGAENRCGRAGTERRSKVSDSTSTYRSNHLPVLNHRGEPLRASAGEVNPGTVNPKQLAAFIVQPPFGGAVADVAIAYKVWNGSNWSVPISGQRFLTHTAVSSGHQVRNNTNYFIGWDGAKWTAVFDPAARTFVQTRIDSRIQKRSPDLHFKGWDNENWGANLR